MNGNPISWQKAKVLISKQNAPTKAKHGSAASAAISMDMGLPPYTFQICDANLSSQTPAQMEPDRRKLVSAVLVAADPKSRVTQATEIETHASNRELWQIQSEFMEKRLVCLRGV